MLGNFSHLISAAIIGTAVVVMQPQIAVPQTLDEQAIAALAKEVTVVINGQNPGSGAIISKQGNTYFVLTAKHVVATPDEYEILTSDGTKHILDYRTVKKFPGVDLALVQFTSNQNYPVAILGNSDQAKEGATVYTSGWPHPGRAITERIYQVTPGKISGRPLKPLEDGYALVYTNITRSGMSGGPVLDAEGRVIGIHGRAEGEPIFNPETGATVDIKSGFNLGIPINSFMQLAAQAGVNLPYSFFSFSLVKTIKKTEADAEAVTSLAITPDGQSFVAGTYAGEIQLWNLQTGELKKSIGEHSARVFRLLISPDGQTLVSGSDDEKIKVWNLQTGQLKATISGEPMVISPDGQTLAGYNSEKNELGIQLWNLSTKQPIKAFQFETHRPGFTFRPNGEIVTFNGITSEVEIWDIRADKMLRKFTIEENKQIYHSPICVSVTPDDRILIAQWYGGRTRVWNLETGEFIRYLPDSEGNYYCSSKGLDPHGQIYVTGSRYPHNGNVYLWNLRTGSVHILPDANAPVAISPDGQTIIAAQYIISHAHGTKSFFYLNLWRSLGR